MSENIIELKGIRKSYDNTKDVVSDFNLEIKKGEFVTFLGPSGCGKTTTLRMIAGFELPSEGQILLHGKDISELPPNKRPVNTVFQRYALFPHLNIRDNIAFGLKIKKMSKEEIDKKVARVLKIVDLEGMENRSIATLSGGQQQRIAIARAIVNEPEILLLDEPLGALDLKMRQEMQLELKAMHEKLGMTFIYVTHDQEEAITMSDKIVVMSDGKIQQIGTAEEIYNEPENVFVADFIGESNIYNGVMTKRKEVQFCDAKFECLDDLPTATLTDVVVRPEDVNLTEPGKGQMNATVISNIFKGIHYQIVLQSGKNEIVAKSTKPANVGDTVGVYIEPDGIHVIPAKQHLNHFEGVITKYHTVEFAGGEFECDVTQLFPGSYHDDKIHLFSKDGERIHLTGMPVYVDIPVEYLDMSDDETAGGVVGEIVSLIYVGDHYRYTVRTESQEDFVIRDEDLWNEYDRVSVIIPPDQIKLTLRESEE
ncbi:MAG: polyamine ABC transporter ATP-binding protein [Lachnospiraceae bacterium]|nr:polyamine ABC transporter ATP-binding protein [Lachnospiraceae bacterium]